jgi:hypothetical protein
MEYKIKENPLSRIDMCTMRALVKRRVTNRFDKLVVLHTGFTSVIVLGFVDDIIILFQSRTRFKSDCDNATSMGVSMVL